MAYSVFSDGTLSRQTKIGMINKCLITIGEVPIEENTVLEDIPEGTDVAIAKSIVEASMREIQSRGWYFNMDFDFKLYPDNEGYISLPDNVLRVDGIRDNRFIDRGKRIYDTVNHTYIIKDAPYVLVDIVWLVDYDELPVEAYEYIAARAARIFQERVVGAAELSQAAERSEMETYINLQRRQLQTMEYNIQNERVSNRLSNAYVRQGLYHTKGRL